MGPVEVAACFPVKRLLRPHVGTAGYRIQENLVYGRFLYIDDLVTGEADRGQRIGARLIRKLLAVAGDEGCERLVLDTALGNALAQRFCFRQGLPASALRFGRRIDAP